MGLLQSHERHRRRTRQAEVGSAPVFVVHGRRHAEAALAAAAACRRPVILASGEGAAAYAGLGWFRELTAIAAAGQPAARFEALIDCSDNPALVVLALREGFRLIGFRGRPALARRLKALALRNGAALVTRRLDALDLGPERDPEAAARLWLERAPAKRR